MIQLNTDLELDKLAHKIAELIKTEEYERVLNLFDTEQTKFVQFENYCSRIELLNFLIELPSEYRNLINYIHDIVKKR